MRFDGVEVKVSLDGEHTVKAVEALNLPDVDPWKIFFLEDVTSGLSAGTPLQDRQLILRARQKTKGKDDVTVKFRPGRRSQLTDAWLGTTTTSHGNLKSEFKVEADWAGDRRTLALSLTADRPKDLVAGVAAGERSVRALFTDDQKRLLDQCAGFPLNLDVLTVLPPIAARRWPTFAVNEPHRPPLDVRAERWTVGDLDFLELSISVALEVAEEAQQALLSFVAHRGLKVGEGPSKTTQVLQLLVAKAAHLPSP
ncbi:hypothetical protein JIG36_04120 [Actinoplanes sp. LDG1-06]|uniref:CYTH domain-containing protein n=1 Tax=Paractinoplanes ovalisporus TaxID=2810368 RepID=A0ABS2A4G0_9ACTN|nr:hypothetical protein [Actinoplanes ovalisporus]MBM2614740.1 hypothetical protein [Actinoplanes ovalisporus]